MKNTIPFSKPFSLPNFYLALLFFLPKDFSLFLNLFSILPHKIFPYHSQLSGAVNTLGLPIGIPRILFSYFSKKDTLAGSCIFVCVSPSKKGRLT
jgi:hypothetical protein